FTLNRLSWMPSNWDAACEITMMAFSVSAFCGIPPTTFTMMLLRFAGLVTFTMVPVGAPLCKATLFAWFRAELLIQAATPLSLTSRTSLGKFLFFFAWFRDSSAMRSGVLRTGVGLAV